MDAIRLQWSIHNHDNQFSILKTLNESDLAAQQSWLSEMFYQI
jgi:hypothetical protein